ncbi:hypothetical protein [Marinactinospora rubrisoli]|uniref:Secreted protein n=1 Tax=Marinactinospora rubrisoli TaxID=2715399 RepID=A0ABW2KD04_9ACTN
MRITLRRRFGALAAGLGLAAGTAFTVAPAEPRPGNSFTCDQVLVPPREESEEATGRGRCVADTPRPDPQGPGFITARVSGPTVQCVDVIGYHAPRYVRGEGCRTLAR